MLQSPNLFSQAVAFHRALPVRIRQYLNARGIPDETIDAHLLGWNGSRITIPIRNRHGETAFFKLRKDPDDRSDSPKMLAWPAGMRAELYGGERVLANPESIIICEGEFDRLVLEARGFAALTSTAGAGSFGSEWAAFFQEIPHVYVCFDHDEAGRIGAARVARLIPKARAVAWPEEIGAQGDVTDFFVRLGRSADDFRRLLAQSKTVPAAPDMPNPASAAKDATAGAREDILELKTGLAIEDVIRRYLPLRRSGQNHVARCPFHSDRTPSFIVFPQTRSFFCFGCREHGDVFSFLMKMEHLSFPEALNVIRQL